MLAIHNSFFTNLYASSVANAFAKLSKCQQFTTSGRSKSHSHKLQTLLQSYQNVSNSQPVNICFCGSFCCKRFCKVIKMLAIHNSKSQEMLLDFVANAFAKLSKCQQFTTLFSLIYMQAQLQTLLQSYQNVSNSQPSCSWFLENESCKRFCKVIKMLAIHNHLEQAVQVLTVANAFAKLSKCQQFTTICNSYVVTVQLQTLLQSYQNVSNSQHCHNITSYKLSCKRFCKVIKMLAIHNFLTTY